MAKKNAKFSKKFGKQPVTRKNILTLRRAYELLVDEFCDDAGVWRDLLRDNDIKKPTMEHVIAWIGGPL